MIDSKYKTRYTDYKNKSLDWLGMDCKSLYQQNLKTRYSDLKRYGWIDNHFTYNFNSCGFRCKDFVDGSNIMFLGCSQTTGVGVPAENTWAEIVSAKLGMHCANLGIGGSSMDTAFRMCHGYIDKIKPKLVVLMKNPKMRLEIFNKNDPENLGPWVDYSETYDRWITNDYNDFFLREKNTLAIQMMCNTRKIKLVESNVVDYEEIQIDFARDLAHFGVETHKLVADDVLSKIQ
jgi:hypothetical protein